MVTGASDLPGCPPAGDGEAGIEALRLVLTGRVQGVGFRPFVYRLATTHALSGWVRNNVGLVEIFIEGESTAIQAFTRNLFRQAPSLAEPELESCETTESAGLATFTIRDSVATGTSRIHVPPDLFTCDDCLAELHDSGDRRYRYPFINCTQCGPRYTLIRGMPYDRPATTMAGFELCDHCRKEYRDPGNRRYHAEPVACPACGPSLEFRAHDGDHVAGNEAALQGCIAALRAGKIVAVKGIGGYHLVCDARNDAVIGQLRDRKPRPHKPLAVMFPAPAEDPLRYITPVFVLARRQAELLLAPGRPIVLLRKLSGCDLSGQIAPGLDEIGVMLPYSPLHHLLLEDFGTPLVATSANISGEPVLTENETVEQRLGHVADAFLHHNRPIQRPADDPVYRIIRDLPRPLRLGRGCAPLEQSLPGSLDRPVLAVGGHMKNTIALAWERRIVVSPHIGDMGNRRSLAVFEQTIRDLQALYDISAEAVICDAHPGYASTRWAEGCGLPLQRIFHHHAHAAVACTAGTGDTDWLVFTWDGVGYGEDGTLWGGEALLGRPGSWQRFASLKPFHLPGGERAGREPWRSAAAICWETAHDWPGLPAEATLLQHAWQRRLNAPRTTAAGRLFDAAAALTGVCLKASFEGQGPMLLEALAEQGDGAPVPLPLTGDGSGVWMTDWAPLIPRLLDTTIPGADRAACFHASLAHAILQQAEQARAAHGITRIGLSGGVFQNRLLTEQASRLLQTAGFEVSMPAHIPVNDAGISFGQVIEYAARLDAGN
jgi:hydrogenase maturation protein HypF